MPASRLLQTGVFAAGLALGIGGATTVLRSQHPPPPTRPLSSTGLETNERARNGPNVVYPSQPLSGPTNPADSRAQMPIIDQGSNSRDAGYSGLGGSGIGGRREEGGGSGRLVFGETAYEVSTEVFRHGFPGPIPDILKRKAYVAAYDRRMRHPAWTAEHLTSASLMRSPSPIPTPTTTSPMPSPDPYALTTSNPVQPPVSTKGDRARSQFMEDEDVPGMFRAQLKDYFRSGYDRGHMVPAADAKSSQLAMDETFLLTNVAPQVGEGFNRHYWAYVEDFCRRLTGKFEDVYVFTIPLYLPSQGVDGKWRVSYEVIGSPPSISVPTHFAKVILTSSPASKTGLGAVTAAVLHPGGGSGDASRVMSVGAFVLPNQPIPDEVPLTQFVVPIEAVEKAAGLTLFSNQVKRGAKELCRETKCEVIVRRFDDATKNAGGRGPQRPGSGGPVRRNST